MNLKWTGDLEKIVTLLKQIPVQGISPHQIAFTNLNVFDWSSYLNPLMIACNS